MKTASEIRDYIIGQIGQFKFELETTQGYLSSHKNNVSYVEERRKEIAELKIKIAIFEELLKEINN